MRVLAERSMVEVRLSFDGQAPASHEGHASRLRGAVGRLAAYEPLLHQHDEEGKPLYRYPLVHYRWHHGNGVIAGFGAAAGLVRNVNWLDLRLDVEHTTLHVVEATIRDRQARYGIADRLVRYEFKSPVLLFNQRNYPRYKELNGWEKTAETDRLLVAQTLVALRGLDVEFSDRLYAAFTTVREVPCPFKGQTLLGIRGEFVTNAVLPDGFAVGHAVSHGFGYISSTSPRENPKP